MGIFEGLPARLEFRDPDTGEVIRGVSAPIPHYSMVQLRVEAFEPCSRHYGFVCNCADKVRTGYFEGPWNMSVIGFANVVQTSIVDTGETVTTTSGNSLVLAANASFYTATIVAGTGTNATSFGSAALQTYAASASGSIVAVVGAVNTSSQGFNATGTITNNSGGNITYSEVALQVSTPSTGTSGSVQLTHDVFTGLVVSNGGTLAVTYLIAFS